MNIEVITPIPPDIINNHGNVVLGMDIMKVNNVSFLTTISRVVQFASGTEMKSADMSNVVIALTLIVQTYRTRGFIIIPIAADGGFAALRENVDFIKLNIVINITAENEHEPYSERFNRTLKERCRMILATAPFLIIPRRMIVELVYLQVFWYNYTIPENYISITLGSGTNILGRTYDYNHICGKGQRIIWS